MSFPKQLIRELLKLVRKEQKVEQRSLDKSDTGTRVGRGGWETLWGHQAEEKEQTLGEGGAGERGVGNRREPRNQDRSFH